MQVELRKIAPIPRWEGREVPPFTPEEYGQRFEALRSRAAREGVERIVVYGDKLHFGDIDFFTGLQIKWEEALLVVGPERGSSTLLLGNEMYGGYPESSPARAEFRTVHCPSLSLPGQVRHFDAPGVCTLAQGLRKAGLTPGVRVGLIGWKSRAIGEFSEGSSAHFVPEVFVRAIAEATGCENIPNLSGIMIDPENGLRARNDAHSIAWMEGACSRVSNALASLIEGLVPGMSEADAAGLWRYRGERLSADPVVLFGQKRIDIGFATASPGVWLRKGDRVFTGIGYDGAFATREGRALAYRDMGALKGALEKIYFPYFAALKAWYETVKVGASGAEVYALMKRMLGDSFALNPGHQIDRGAEWTTSPIDRDSPYTLRSGMALQFDMITMTDAEDGIALADEGLRRELAEGYPACWSRIRRRRALLERELGIHADDSLLPLSNLQARVMPCLLSPLYAVVARTERDTRRRTAQPRRGATSSPMP
jgi:Xaa-Pro aminopeptidase